MLSIFIQDGSETAENLEPLVQEKTLSIMELLMDGGMAGQIIIGVLFVLLFTAVYLYFERLFAIKAATDYDVNFMDEIRNNVSSGNLEAAKVLCAKKNTPVSRLTEKGISRIGSPLEDINTAIENAGKLEVYKLEKNVSILATIAGAAPMIGFLGTVIGMVLAFHNVLIDVINFVLLYQRPANLGRLRYFLENNNDTYGYRCYPAYIQYAPYQNLDCFQYD